mgnify:CR=1 FL=1
MRILALDWGEVRIGGAVSDPEGKIAFPLEKYIGNRNALEEITKIVKDLEVLGYSVSHNEVESTRLDNVYTLKIPNSIDEIKCTINKQIILFNHFLGGIEFGVDVWILAKRLKKIFSVALYIDI